jgi:hypothetical protein
MSYNFFNLFTIRFIILQLEKEQRWDSFSANWNECLEIKNNNESPNTQICHAS